ncbi:flagellar hook-length control protein FliK [Neptunomonas sp.]|uniref:flagellar hook-length control protein FliK n=1 Tax=Neptunomonas sp. TaxID=1971898 RepID=UPI0025D3DC61|nr:flagellar hook-length control protein FliK [Neptunomonas sp.]
MNTITPQSLSLLDSTGKASAGSANKLIPANGSLQATVRQVSQDKLTPNVFRLKLETNNTLMELKTQHPLPAGSKVLISRTSDGQLSIKLAPPTISEKAASPPTLANKTDASRTYQVPVSPIIRSEKDSITLLNTIPRGQTVTAKVTSQTIGLPTTNSQKTASPLNPTLLQHSKTAVQSETISTPPTSTKSQPATPQTINLPRTDVSTANKPQQTQTQHSPSPKINDTQPAPAGNTQGSSTQTKTAPPSPLIQAPLITQKNQSTEQTARPSQQQTSTITPTQIQGPKYTTEQPTNTLTVSIKGSNLTLKTSSNLPPLQQIQISRNHSDQFSISWTQPIATSSTSTSMPVLTPQQAVSINNNLRELLPQQITLTSGIQQLLSLSQASNTNTAGKIDKVVQSLMQLFGVQPGAAEAQQTIKQNIHFGGLFTENKLNKNQASPTDMKQFLGKVQALAEQLPISQKQIIQSTVGKMLARITTNQLSSLQSKQERVESNERFFQLDLPIRNQNVLENVELRISHRSQQNSRLEHETIWKVRLHFDLEKSGSVDAELSLNQEQNELTAAFVCSDHNTASSIKDRLSDFKAQLNTLGLSVPTLSCKQGKHQPQKAPVQKQLIDIKT